LCRKKFQRKGVGGSFAKVARQKWQALERRIMDIVMQRMTITNMEADMDRLIKKREELAVQQEALLRKREKFLNDPLEDEKPLQEMNEEIEVLNANIDYINDSLSDCQATIMQIEETKDELDSVDTSVVISSCSLAEARHLLDHFLKASIEKVSALRRLTKPMSDRVAGRVSRRLNTLDSGAELSASTTSSEPESARSVSNIVRQWNKKINGYVGEPEPAVNGAVNGARTPRKKFQRKGVGGSFAKVARQKWQALERRIMDIVMQRMTITNMEADMDRLIKKREELAVQQEALLRKREKFLNDPLEDEKPLQEMNEEIEVLNANIDYINDSLSDCQATIMQIEETKDELDSVDTSVVISSCSLAEARHLLDHFLKASIEKGLQVAQKETQIRLLEGRLRQTDMTGSAQNHMILDALREKAECIPELQALIHNVQQENGYASTDEEVSEFSQASEGSFSQSFTLKVSASQDDFKLKNEPKLSVQMKAVSAEYLGPSLDVSSRNMAKSLASLSEIRENGVVFSSRDSYSRDKVSRTISLPTRGNTLSDDSDSSLSELLRGVINPVGGIKGARTAPLQCVSVAEGHSKPVLCLDATDELLFTGSKDRTCKMWNLVTGQEIITLRGHPNNVVSVKYCSSACLVFTVSTSYIKVWDIRDAAKCVRTLTSSGQVISGDACASNTTRTVTTAQGEFQINQIALNPSGSMLYAAAGNTVRTWDLNRMQAMGKLTGHIGSVMCLTVCQTVGNHDQVITGSKDHYVKMFDNAEGTVGNVGPTHNFEPPHYDGIECLAIQGDILFSGSRDNGIKKWDLEQQELLQRHCLCCYTTLTETLPVLLHNTHRDTACAVTHLFSGSRDNGIKKWDLEQQELLQVRGFDLRRLNGTAA
ncbi:UNVERIFIED_CONTAM: hypothetical protein FKN15_034558, partial [Acipenser sinensis]